MYAAMPGARAGSAEVMELRCRKSEHPAGVDWTQLYAVMSGGEGHVALFTWNHFDYGKQSR